MGKRGIEDTAGILGTASQTTPTEGVLAVGQCAVVKQSIDRGVLGGLGRCGTSGHTKTGGKEAERVCTLSRRGPRHARCKRIVLGGVAAGLQASAERSAMWDKRDRIGTRESTKRKA